MQIQKIGTDTLVVADTNKYLIVKSLEERASVEMLGKIQAVRFTGDFVPELEEITKEEVMNNG